MFKSFNPFNNPRRYYSYSYFINEETEVLNLHILQKAITDNDEIWIQVQEIWTQNLHPLSQWSGSWNTSRHYISPHVWYVCQILLLYEKQNLPET